MEDPADLLGSRNLVTFSMDCTHLYNVLQSLARSNQQISGAMNTLGKKVSGVEGALDQLAARVSRLESANGGEDLRQLRSHVIEISRTVDGITTTIPQLVQQHNETRSAVSSIERNLSSVDKTFGDYRTQLESVSRRFDDTHRAIVARFDQERANAETVERSRALQHQKSVEDFARELSHRMDVAEKDIAQKFGTGLDEINRRTAEAFRNTDANHKALDGELGKLRAEINNIRAELNTVDNDARHGAARLKEDTDQKFVEVLNALQNFEHNSVLMERHIAEAGRALANPRASTYGLDFTPSQHAPTPRDGSASAQRVTSNW